MSNSPRLLVLAMSALLVGGCSARLSSRDVADPGIEYLAPARPETQRELHIDHWEVESSNGQVRHRGVDADGNVIGHVSIEVQPANSRLIAVFSTGVRIVWERAEVVEAPAELDDETALWLAAVYLDRAWEMPLGVSDAALVGEGGYGGGEDPPPEDPPAEEPPPEEPPPEEPPPAEEPPAEEPPAEEPPAEEPPAEEPPAEEPPPTEEPPAEEPPAEEPPAETPPEADPWSTPETPPSEEMPSTEMPSTEMPSTEMPAMPRDMSGVRCFDDGAITRDCTRAAWECGPVGWASALRGALGRALGRLGGAAAETADGVGCVGAGSDCMRSGMGRACTESDLSA